MIKNRKSLEDYIHTAVQKRWLDITKDYLGALNATIYRDKNFPEKITPYVLSVVKTEDEANMALDIIFNKINVMQCSERFSDYHNLDYIEGTIGIHINTKNAIVLAKNKDMLAELIQEKSKIFIG